MPYIRDKFQNTENVQNRWILLLMVFTFMGIQLFFWSLVTRKINVHYNFL